MHFHYCRLYRLAIVTGCAVCRWTAVIPNFSWLCMPSHNALHSHYAWIQLSANSRLSHRHVFTHRCPQHVMVSCTVRHVVPKCCSNIQYSTWERVPVITVVCRNIDCSPIYKNIFSAQQIKRTHIGQTVEYYYCLLFTFASSCEILILSSISLL